MKLTVPKAAIAKEVCLSFPLNTLAFYSLKYNWKHLLVALLYTNLQELRCLITKDKGGGCLVSIEKILQISNQTKAILD